METLWKMLSFDCGNTFLMNTFFRIDAQHVNMSRDIFICCDHFADFRVSCILAPAFKNVLIMISEEAGTLISENDLVHKILFVVWKSSN